MSKHNKTTRSQMALVLQGGGTLGAYEAGVLKVLCKKLTEQGNENGKEGRLLFDIVAGTSIGTMNGAILVRQFLETQNWQKAAEKLKFWTNQLSVKSLDISQLSLGMMNGLKEIQLLLLKRLPEGTIQLRNRF